MYVVEGDRGLCFPHDFLQAVYATRDHQSLSLVVAAVVRNGPQTPADAAQMLQSIHENMEQVLGEWGSWDALERKGPQRPPQRQFDRRLEEVAKAAVAGYCRL